MGNTTAQRAFDLAQAGFAVFPVREDKTPYASDGLKSATLDPYAAQDTFEKHKRALIGIHAGQSGIVVLDTDYKTDEDGNVTVDGFTALENAWLEIPATYSYTSVNGHGEHRWYTAPEGLNLAPKAAYRGMKGVDRRSGESYVVFTGDTLPDRNEFAPAPEWLCDESKARTIETFEGDLKDWYDSLTPGQPNIPVRKAMERTRALFEINGEDLSHSDIVERSFEAIRLGAEGNPGVPELLDLIEEFAVTRTGAHSRPEDEWEGEYQEALLSGIEKYGAVLPALRDLPAWSPSDIPSDVPDHLWMGPTGDETDFRILLGSLWKNVDPALGEPFVTSVLWNAPKTKEFARDIGFSAVSLRVREAEIIPEPVSENPSLEAKKTTPAPTAFLTDEERERVGKTATFMDTYRAASALKGFSREEHDIPAAWTCLSMTFGTKAYVPYSGALGVNLWFILLGYTGTGKTSSLKFLSAVLDLLMREDGSYYNVGADSSPAAIHEELLGRDGKPSMVKHDEASSFFSDLKKDSWSKALEYNFSSFYDGGVEPSNKVRLPKELRGKSATTSFNLYMMGTPDELTELITTGMFDTGFLSRVNWTWAPPREDSSDRYKISLGDTDTDVRAHPVVYDLALDLMMARIGLESAVKMGATDEALDRVSKAYEAFDRAAQGHELYSHLQGPVTRLLETILKTASLTALYRGSIVVSEDDVLVAISHASEWFQTLLRVLASVSDSEFSRDTDKIEDYVRSHGGNVTRTSLLHAFRSLIQRSPRELDDRLDFLVASGRLIRQHTDKAIRYELNGGASE